MIDVSVACADWTKACPAAEHLVRDAAEMALVHATQVLRLKWRNPVELGITLTDAADQRRLNRDYRGVDKATNVLAFSAWQPEASLPQGAPILLGDVVLALETVADEACKQNKFLDDHIRHLVVHGVLHLLGYEHSGEAEAAMMESLEKSILAEMGVPDPYRDTMSSVEPAAPLP